MHLRLHQLVHGYAPNLIQLQKCMYVNIVETHTRTQRDVHIVSGEGESIHLAPGFTPFTKSCCHLCA